MEEIMPWFKKMELGQNLAEIVSRDSTIPTPTNSPVALDFVSGADELSKGEMNVSITSGDISTIAQSDVQEAHQENVQHKIDSKKVKAKDPHFRQLLHHARGHRGPILCVPETPRSIQRNTGRTRWCVHQRPLTKWDMQQPLGGILLVTIIFHAILYQKIHAKVRVPRETVNIYIVKQRAKSLSCERHNCTQEIQCPYSDGWYIQGSDTGCCGNYDGCCRLASIWCWTHDLFCRCCEYGMFLCGPLCQKDPDCPEEEGSGEIHVVD